MQFEEDINLEEELLVEKLKEYNAAYRRGEPSISDAEYDELLEELRLINPDNPFLESIESEKFDSRKEIKHPFPMLSIEKAYFREDIRKFLARVKKEALEIGIEDFSFIVTPKLDGIAGRDDGVFLVTRGNGETGYEITSVFEKGVVAVQGRGKGLGELVIMKSYFDKFLSDKFEHPRNMIAGIAASDNLNEYAKKALDERAVHFVPYSALPKWEGKDTELFKNIDKITEELTAKTDYPIDGMVAFVTNEKIKEYMGATAHHYRWQIAVKTRGETAVTKVLDIIWQVGRSGNITPVLAVEPVFISGATIRRVTAHHAGMVKKLNIGKGSKIEIIRSGEVIPKLENVIEPSFLDIFNIPKKCPGCGGSLVFKSDFLKCLNYNCRAQIEQRIYYWFKTIGNADWFGIKTIEKLVEKGYDDISGIYAIGSQEAFIEAGFGPGQAKNLFFALKTSLITPIEDWRFLSAFGIPNLGKGDSRKLLSHISLSDIANKEIIPSDIEKIYGFGKITSESIASGIKKISKLLRHMLSLNFNIIKTESISEKNAEKFFFGKKVVFTGKMNSGTREDMQEKAIAAGALVQTAVNGKTDYLICGENVGAKKIEKAKSLNVKTIDEDTFWKYLRP